MIYTILGSVVLIVLVIDLGMRVYFGRKALQLLEKMPVFHVEPTPPQKQAVPFEVPTSDGLTLRGGIFHPDLLPPRGVILFCPETMSSHWSVVKYCQSLMDAGFIVISFDFRNQGESDSLPGYESLHWVTEYEIRDLHAVLDWIGEQAAFAGLPLGVMGISRGASAALLALSARDDVQFLCSDSGYTNHLLISQYIERWAPLIVPRFVLRICPSFWHIRKTLDVAIWLRGWKRNCRYLNTAQPFEKMTGKQVLLIAGAKDSYVPNRLTRELQRQLGSQCADMWLVSKANHNGARQQAPDLYDAKVVNFFNQMIPLHEPVEQNGTVENSDEFASPQPTWQEPARAD